MAPSTSHEFMTRPLDYVLILLPVTAGIGVSLLSEVFSKPHPAFSLFTLLLYLFGIGSAIGLVHAINRVEEFENKRASR